MGGERWRSEVREGALGPQLGESLGTCSKAGTEKKGEEGGAGTRRMGRTHKQHEDQ